MGIFDFFRKGNKDNLREDYDESFQQPIEEENKNEGDTSVLYNFDLQDEKEPKYTNEINFKRVSLTEEEIDNLIIEQVLMVINSNSDLKNIEKASSVAASNIGKEYIERLSTYLEGKISRPPYMKDRYDGLGQWATVIENAVLAILYSFKQYGVDELLKLTMSNKNIKFKAINILCKLANESIDRDKVIDSIIFIMRDMRENELIKVLGYMSQIKNNGKVEKLLKLYYKKYILENKFQDAYEITLDLMNNRGSLISEELTFIKSIALVEGKVELSSIVNGSTGLVDLSNLSEDLRIEAAIAFYSIKDDDKEINDRLHYLKDNSLNVEIRKYLSGILSKSRSL